MDHATVGHNLRPLERDELITVAVSEADRRVRIVSITDEGLSASHCEDPVGIVPRLNSRAASARSVPQP